MLINQIKDEEEQRRIVKKFWNDIEKFLEENESIQNCTITETEDTLYTAIKAIYERVTTIY
jgi:hypothetical protein